MSGKGIKLLGVTLGMGMVAATARADVHSWDFNEIYTNASGSVQFIELDNLFNGEQYFKTFNNVHLISKNSDASLQQTFVFPTDLSSAATAGKSLLIGTANMGSLPDPVTPDFVIPANFIYDGGSLQLTATTGFHGTFETVSFSDAQLPNDGLNALVVGAPHITAAASPMNFAGDTGAVPEPAGAGIGAILGGLASLRRRPL